jgi:hypothetical protein
MNEINYKAEYELLSIENNQLKDEIKTLKEHLKKYTAPKRSKTYYENHKNEIIQKVKEYQANKNQDTDVIKQPIISEKKREYNKRAYEKRKLKNIT